MTVPPLPELGSFGWGPVINDAITEIAEEVAAVPSLLAAWRFDVSHYGGVGDDSADDSVAINAAVTAAIAYARSSSNDGYAEVYFPHAGPWKVGGSLLTTGGCYAQIPLPAVPQGERRITLALIGPPSTGSQAGYNQTGQQVTGAVIRSTLTGATYDATHGLPSVIGGPDYEKFVVPGVNYPFSNMILKVRDLIVRRPDNPSTTGLNMAGIAGYDIDRVLADTNVAWGQAQKVGTGTGVAAQPTHPTGIGILFPQQNNNALCRAGLVSVWGNYAGVMPGEHTVIDFLISVRNKMHVGLLTPGGHDWKIVKSAVEWAQYIVAGNDYTGAGVTSLTAGSGNGGALDFAADIEDNVDSGDWANNVAHILDANGVLRGVFRFTHAIEGTGVVSGGLTVTGGGRLNYYDLSNTGEWIPATLLSSWVNFGAAYAGAAYRKRPDGMVELKGLVKSGNTSGSTTHPILILPDGYRPIDGRIFAASSGSGCNSIEIGGTASGVPGAVWSDAGTNASIALDGICFQAEQ